MKPARPTKQIYSNYTEEDFSVWEILYKRQMNILEPVVSEEYLKAIGKVNFTANRIPHFGETDVLLQKHTGWSIETVPNICPDKEFFEFLSQKKFTATCWLRTKEQLDYLEEPDMFHDVFGHIPLLSNNAYCEFFKGISEIALDYHENAEAISLLSRIYWFTIEFGLMRESGKLKIYGSGIISSNSETIHAIDKKTTKLDFDVEQMLNTPYRTDIIQDKYFVVDSFDQLFHSLPLIRSSLAKKLETIDSEA
jgi:phenylalanine-4-hydroxylase